MSRTRLPGERPVSWVGSARRDLLAMPADVVDDLGYALGVVQLGGIPPSVKPWKGAGAGVFELVEDAASGTFRVVLTVRFPGWIYVLHCFQKKSPSGIRTRRSDVELVRERLRVASADYEARHA